jgi:hypothetical protein
MINEPAAGSSLLQQRKERNCRSGFKQKHHFEKGQVKMISTIYTMQ